MLLKLVIANSLNLGYILKTFYCMHGRNHNTTPRRGRKDFRKYILLFARCEQPFFFRIKTQTVWQPLTPSKMWYNFLKLRAYESNQSIFFGDLQEVILEFLKSLMIYVSMRGMGVEFSRSWREKKKPRKFSWRFLAKKIRLFLVKKREQEKPRSQRTGQP